MDQLRFVESAYQIQHQHGDGSWAQMEEVPPDHHGPAAHDAERGWLRGRVFRCRSCEETLTVVPGGEGAPPREPGRAS